MCCYTAQSNATRDIYGHIGRHQYNAACNYRCLLPQDRKETMKCSSCSASCLTTVLSKTHQSILLLLLLLLLSSSSSSLLLYDKGVSFTGLFFLVLLLNQQCSPPLRLQASHCSTFRIMCDVPSIAVYYYYYTICMSPVTGISSWYFS